jgi:hypothetical protein
VREVVGVDVDELAFDGDLATRSPGTGAEDEHEEVSGTERSQRNPRAARMTTVSALASAPSSRDPRNEGTRFAGYAGGKRRAGRDARPFESFVAVVFTVK